MNILIMKFLFLKKGMRLEVIWILSIIFYMIGHVENNA